jgi:histidyl-tRNA synthetase
MGSLATVTFDLSLARGLDYYTGVIYEAVLTDPSYGVGSIAAGGRYDNLVGMFAATGTVVPCVGVSVGVERVFAIMEAKAQAESGGLIRTPVSVLVASIPSTKYDMNAERMKVCAQLWAAGLSSEMVFSVDPKLQKQVTVAAEGNIPFMVVLGEDELARGEVQIKNMKDRTAENVKISEAANWLLAAGASRVSGSASIPVAAPPPTPAPAAAVKTEAAPVATSGPAAVGTTVEGTSRLYGRFSRPAAAI